MYYSVETAVEELTDLEAVIERRVRRFLEKRDIINAARGLIAVNKELYRIEEDARKLRLAGELDQKIYKIMIRGYVQIADRIINIAGEHNSLHEIMVLHKALRFTTEVSTLADYLREDNR